MIRYKVGIIGLGFVGKAIQESYRQCGHNCTIITIDPLLSDSASYDMLVQCDYVFVCVPSPQKEDGSCDTSILDEVLQNLYAIKYKGVIISKVTAPPSYYKKTQKIFDNLVYVPEFLTATNSVRDYLTTKYHLIGTSNRAYFLLAREALEVSFGNDTDCHHVSIEEASMIKYAVNSFLATKVVWMNELKELCNKVHVNYNKVTSHMALDKRIGNSHMDVPGPDGMLGFGGACFPKDTNAFLTYAQDNDILLSVLDKAVEKNNNYR
jgi:UDPglucose 6-dehydrogenase